MLLVLLQIGGVHSKDLQGRCHSTTNGTNKEALTASGVEPTNSPNSVSIPMVGQHIYPLMSIQHQ